jgi:hypothetical protein
MRNSSFIASTLAVPARKIACESARMILFMMFASYPQFHFFEPAQSPFPAKPYTATRLQAPASASSGIIGKTLQSLAPDCICDSEKWIGCLS